MLLDVLLAIVLCLIAALFFGLYKLSVAIARRSGKRWLGFLVFVSICFFLFAGDYVSSRIFIKWFCQSDEPLVFAETATVSGYDLNVNQDRILSFGGPRGCGSQCAAALIDYGFKYAEVTVRNPNEIFLTTSPGHYKFYLSTPEDPACALFTRMFRRAGEEPLRDFHYTKVPENKCIASTKIGTRSALFEKSEGLKDQRDRYNTLLDIGRYVPVIERAVDQASGEVVWAVERYYFYDNWFMGLVFRGFRTSQCVVREYRRWPALMALRDQYE